MVKPNFIQGKPAKYDHTPSPDVKRLRKLDLSLHESNVDYFVEQEALLSRRIPIDFPIPAIRGWNLDSVRGKLLSLAFYHEWDSPVEREHTNPRRTGTSGFWAVKPCGIHVVQWYRPDIVGIVELSGLVVEHTIGWRAEVCTIVALFTDMELAPFEVRRIEDRYQCDLFEGSLEQAARRLTS